MTTFKPGDVVYYYYTEKPCAGQPSFPNYTKLVVIENDRETNIRVRLLENPGISKGVYPKNLRHYPQEFCYED